VTGSVDKDILAPTGGIKTGRGNWSGRSRNGTLSKKNSPGKGKPEPPPIEAVGPPPLSGGALPARSSRCTLDSGTASSSKQMPRRRIETRAEPSLSKIKVTAHAIRYTGADEMVSVTTKGFIQAQLEFATGSPPLPTSRQAPAMNLLNRQPPRTTLEPMPLAPRTAAGRLCAEGLGRVDGHRHRSGAPAVRSHVGEPPKSQRTRSQRKWLPR